MASLRRVEGEQAGPAALGILVPPGPRTIVVLRPRSLTWDLVALRSKEAPAFLELAQAEASVLADHIFQSMNEWTPRGPGLVASVVRSVGAGFQVQAEIGAHVLLACRRVPGKPYHPRVFASAAEAREVAAMLASALCPEDGMDLEVYFNTRNFK